MVKAVVVVATEMAAGAVDVVVVIATAVKAAVVVATEIAAGAVDVATEIAVEAVMISADAQTALVVIEVRQSPSQSDFARSAFIAMR